MTKKKLYKCLYSRHLTHALLELSYSIQSEMSRVDIESGINYAAEVGNISGVLVGIPLSSFNEVKTSDILEY